LPPDGKIVGTGRSNSSAFIYRVNDNGSTDNTFGTSGEVRHDLSTGSQDVWNGMAYTFDGKLVVSGVATGDFALGRFGAGGSMLMGANAAMSQRLWFQQDANFNVTSVSNDATGGNGGVAVERYVYTPYGERTVLHSDFTPVASGASLFAVDEGHQGLSTDAETGLVQNRYRYLHVTLGRFTSPDPHPQGRYVDGMNGYGYLRSSPQTLRDPIGLAPNQEGATDPDYLLSRIQELERQGHSDEAILHAIREESAHNSNRYIYTDKYGWIDLRHFSAAAEETQTYGGALTEVGGLIVEIQQWFEEGPDDYQSAFSPEDLPSNSAGADLGEYYMDDSKSLYQAVLEFLGDAGARNRDDKLSKYDDLPLNDPNRPKNPCGKADSNSTSSKP
jgi:RHS repeat-associated protein